ncbi:MAG TPA: hypothetical protein VFR67_29685 [Pilimelia sp.]|nr:hypothetical protein [Pilimelia sp.]
MIWRWTGAGWLSPVFIIASFLIGAFVGNSVGAGFEGKATTSALVVSGVVAALAPVHWWIGRALNSRKEPDGRYWHDEHTFLGVPVQRVAFGQVVLALALGSFAVGRATSAWVGWAMFVAVLIAVPVARGRSRWRRRMRDVADRVRLAQARGWRYRARYASLAMRWKAGYGRKVYAMSPFGVIGGELNGLPFTAFDTEVPGSPQELRTILAVHLPVSYPRFRVAVAELPKRGEFDPKSLDELMRGVPTADHREHLGMMFGARLSVRPEDLRPQSDNTAFGTELLSPAVRELTVRHNLGGWHIEGRDLLLWLPGRESPTPATELLHHVERLVELAHGFPVGLEQRYGTPPTTDVPLVDAARAAR